MKYIEPKKKLWDAINKYVRACGGDPSRNVYVKTIRQQVIIEIENLVFDVLKQNGVKENE
jgi:hypothetical protein